MRRMKLLVLVIVAIAALAAPGYASFPDPLPDFAHPWEPHDRYPAWDNNASLSVEDGNNHPPTLIIYRQFTDTPIPAGMGPGAVRQKVFSSGTSNAEDYFQAVSYGKFRVTPAAESYGTPNDGVVVINDMTLGDYLDLVDSDRSEAGGSAIRAASSFVDFSVFDVRGGGADGSHPDGVVTYDELQIIHVAGWWHNDGVRKIDIGARTANGLDDDGVSVPKRYIVYATPELWYRFFSHELMHTALGARDSYGLGAGEFDQMGTDGNATKPDIGPAPWTRIHLGWITPTVVTRDGYYDIGDAQKYGQSFILYDPARGTDDYFIVENRNQTSQWDTDTQDKGLVIWRIREPFFELDGRENVYKSWMQLMVPRGGFANIDADGNGTIGTADDAWDPSDPTTPERTMNRPWSDETTTTETDNPRSNVAVRAIGPSGDRVRAYLDVPGPGLLVDTADTKGEPIVVKARAGETVDVPFTAMNTGEEYDTFGFGFVGTPDGWFQQPRQWGIGAGVSTTHRVGLVVPDDTLVFLANFRVRGRSVSDASVVCDSKVYVEIVRDEPDITFLTDGGFYREDPRLRVSIANPNTGIGISGFPITFEVGYPDVTHTIAAITNEFGVADVPMPSDIAPGSHFIKVRTPLTSHLLPVERIDWYDLVERTVQLSSHLTQSYVDYGETYAFGAIVKIRPSFDPLADQLVRFILPDGEHFAMTQPSGLARVDVPVNWSPGRYQIRVEMADPDFFWPYEPIVRDLTTRGDTVMAYTGPDSGYLDAPSGISARVGHDADPTRGAEGLVVWFNLSKDGVYEWLASATTDENGVAEVSESDVLSLPPGRYLLRSFTPGDSVWQSSSKTEYFTVERRPTVVAYTGATSGVYSDHANLSALVSDALTGEPLASQPVTITVGPQSIAATTGLDGVVWAAPKLDQRDGTTTVAVSFAGDSRNAPGESLTPFEVLREKTTVAYTGDGVVAVDDTAWLSATVLEDPDRSFGDLSLAAVRFWLAPMFGTDTMTYEAPCDATGAAATPAPGLAPDVWTVRAGVRAATHWADSDSAEHELVIANPLRQVFVGAVGRDVAGLELRVMGSAIYSKGEPSEHLQISIAGEAFKPTGMRWLTGAEGNAVAELDGEFRGQPMVARLWLWDPIRSGTQLGSMRLTVTDSAGALHYDAGAVAVEKGRVVIR